MILSKCDLSIASHDRELEVSCNKGKEVLVSECRYWQSGSLWCAEVMLVVWTDYICIMGQRMNANQVSEWREKPPS